MTTIVASVMVHRACERLQEGVVGASLCLSALGRAATVQDHYQQSPVAAADASVATAPDDDAAEAAAAAAPAAGEGRRATAGSESTAPISTYTSAEHHALSALVGGGPSALLHATLHVLLSYAARGLEARGMMIRTSELTHTDLV
jgi:hypothetical protein